MGYQKEKRKQGIENVFEKVMMENFPNLMGEKVTQIQETQRVPSKRNTKGPNGRHIILKWQNSKTKKES